MDVQQVQSFCETRGIKPVSICHINDSDGTLIGVDGKTYFEIETNIWAAEPEKSNAVAFLHSNLHHGGIVLRPMFLKVDGEWLNAATGESAPAGLPYAAQGSGFRKGSVANSMSDGKAFDSGDWRQRAESLVRIAEAARWSETPEATYHLLINAIKSAIECSDVILHLLAFDGSSFIRCAHADKEMEKFSDWDSHLPTSVGRLNWLMASHKPIIMDYEHPCEDDQIPLSAFEAGFRSAVSIPVIAEDSVLGIYSLVFGTPLNLRDGDLEYLQQIGRTLGTAVTRMRAAKKSAELGLLEERRRLSSEIHDNVSHLIGALSLQAGTVMAAADSGDWTAAEKGLEVFEETCGDTMRVFRDEMLSLRAPLERTDGWIDSVESILNRFHSVWGIDISLEKEIESEPLLVNLQSALQLTRILNECLSNVLKHAQATCVNVSIFENDRFLRMTVSDNGKGFDVGAIAPERLGLKIMNERAAIAGGKISITSSEHGTSVCVEVPRIEKP